MARNKSEAFPHSSAIRAYLKLWHVWDAARRPEEGELRTEQSTAYYALPKTDRRLLALELKGAVRRDLITRFKLDAT